MENPKFHALLTQMRETHDRKNADYAHGGNPYSNFEEAAATAGVTVDDVFATLIGIKLARLNALKKQGGSPNNESVQDSRLDLAVYAALWASYRTEAEAAAPVQDEDPMTTYRAAGKPHCGAFNRFYCTRERGHAGQHHAHIGPGVPVEGPRGVWS